jgi:SAM-dependent methyltransferase
MATWGEYYGQLAGALALYRASNHRLVELANLRPGQRVLDLAAGAGLTSEAALAAIPEGLELHVLDLDPTMIEAARARLGNRVAGYHVADAVQVGELVAAGAFGPSTTGPLFDRVLCNLAFFSFRDPEAVLRALRPLVKPTGQLLFSLQNTQFNTGGDRVSPLWALQTELARAGELPKAPLSLDRLPNQRAIEGTLHGAGWKPAAYTLQELGDDPSELLGQLQLYPLALAKGFHTAVARSIDRVEAFREAVGAHKPQWRVVHFQAQPAVDPLKALQAKAAQMGLGGTKRP